MKTLFLGATFLALSATPALAGGLPQQGSNTAIGVGAAKSISASQATAISGQGGQGGKGGTGVGVGVGTGGSAVGGAVIINPGPASTTSTSTIDNVGHSSVSTVPSVFAPGLAAAGIESCLGSVSGGGSWLGTGITLGGSIPDRDCSARLDSRTLWSMGLKKAAVARICQTTEVYNSMPEVCGQYMPRPAPVYAPTALPATYASVQTASLPSGTLMLIEGATGKERPCSNYDEGHQKCRHWADAVTSKPKQVPHVASGPITRPSSVAVPLPVPSPVKKQTEKAVEPHSISRLADSLQTPLWLQMIHPEVQPKAKTEEEKRNEESLVRCLGVCVAPGNGGRS